jgi:hypothetical protein
LAGAGTLNFKHETINNNVMKKMLLFLLLIATSCVTQKTTTSNVENIPVYNTGQDEPAASSGVVAYPDGQ